jgi:hypothetical protein
MKDLRVAYLVLVASTVLLVAMLVCLGPPECEEHPMFYLAGTVADCATSR